MFLQEYQSGLRKVRQDHESLADCVIYPNWPAHEPRARKYDDYRIQRQGSTVYVIRPDEETPPTDSDKVQIRHSPAALCNACISALGYLASYLEGQQQDEERDQTEKQHKGARPTVVHHWNTLSWWIAAAVNGCPLCSTTWTHWRKSADYDLNNARVELLRQEAVRSGSGWESVGEQMMANVLRQLDPFELAERYKTFRTEALLTATEKDFWIDGENAGQARIVFAMSTGNRTGELKDFMTVTRLQLWPSPAFDQYFTHFQLPAPEHASDLHDKANTRASRPLAIKWLARCRENADGEHDACNTVLDVWRPTRMLDVGSVEESGKIHLVNSRSGDGEYLKGDYIALSHCWGLWGALKLPRLNGSSLGSYMDDGISLESLPPTFRDVVEIAGWFDVRYLWIDSLCIIQDSTVDWSHEAPQMCDVYANAVLTVSATGAMDAQKGCFTARDPLAIRPFRLDLPRMNGAWWATVDRRDMFDWVRRAPLSTRAWAYQERRLSRRNLYFTDLEVFWECRAATPFFACESFPDGSPLRSNFLGASSSLPRTFVQGAIEDDKDLRKAWDDICFAFSEMQITKQTDKLPAISGLAKYFSDLCSSDMYLAGMWRSSLPRALLWCIAEEQGDEEPSEPTDSYIAPTWSWTSTNLSISTASAAHHYHSIVNILGVTYKTMSANPFDRIENASLRIEGFLRPVIVMTKTLDRQMGEFHSHAELTGRHDEIYLGDGLKERIGHHTWQHYNFFQNIDNPREGGPQAFECIMLAVIQTRSSKLVAGLLLEPTGKESTYRRVGRVDFFAEPALRMRYRIKQDAAGRIGDSPWRALFDQVMAVRGRPDSEMRGKDIPFTSSGPESLYEFDGPVDQNVFERLQPRTITLV